MDALLVLALVGCTIIVIKAYIDLVMDYQEYKDERQKVAKLAKELKMKGENE